MWILFPLLVALAEEPATGADAKKETEEPATAQTVADIEPGAIVDQLSDILSMLQAIPTDTTADNATASVDAAKADTKTVEEKAK